MYLPKQKQNRILNNKCFLKSFGQYNQKVELNNLKIAVKSNAISSKIDESTKIQKPKYQILRQYKYIFLFQSFLWNYKMCLSSPWINHGLGKKRIHHFIFQFSDIVLKRRGSLSFNAF